MDLINVDEAARKLSVPPSLINFYYADGLLPSNYERGQFVLNSYAFNELSRIVLLQTLGVSLDDIKALRENRLVLHDVLKQRINTIMSDPDDVTQAAIVCQNICLEGCDYRSLDAMPHLEHIRELKSHGGTFPEITIPMSDVMNDHIIIGPASSDSVQKAAGPVFGGAGYPGYTETYRSSYVSSSGYPADAPGYERPFSPFAAYAAIDQKVVYPHPVCRFLSRTLDLMICLFIVTTFVRLFFGLDPIGSVSMGLLAGVVSTSGRSLATAMYLLSHILMFLAEPLLLHFLGTTPGKIIFSVKILDGSGSKLSLKDAYIRSFKLLRYGYGFLIPFYSYYRSFRSLIDCKIGRVLPWDEGLTHSHPERFSYGRLGILIPALVVMSYATTLTGSLFEIPPNKGALTAEQFYENYAYVVRYNSINTADFPELKLTVENNIVKEVSFTVTETDAEIIDSYYQPMYAAYVAFTGSHPSSVLALIYSSPTGDLLGDGSTGFSFELDGVNVTNTVTFNGYLKNNLTGYLYYDPASTEHEYSQTFTMTLLK